jgi:glucose-6-phosphate 1-dehydrogenase
MKMNAKTPGLATRAIPIELDLSYKRRFEKAKIPEAYESLILDAFRGDHSNFVRDDELDVAWEVSLKFTPYLTEFLTYRAADLHPYSPLDRRQGRRGAQARAVPVRIPRSGKAG